MKTGLRIAVILSVLGPSQQTLVAQGLAAVATPALTLSTSPRGNGMGGVEATLPSTDAAATIANPGQLGIFSLENNFSASTYSPKTDLFPRMFTFPDDVTFTMTASALNAGINLKDILSLPFSAGLGVGYSRTFVDWGEIIITNSSSPTPIGRVAMNDTYENYSVGLGLEYIVRLGIGVNFKKIASRFPGFTSAGGVTEFTATPSATDFGILLDIPLVTTVSKAAGMSLSIAKVIDPFLDISMSYVKSNVGDVVIYVDPSRGDPLPRTAVVGLGLEGGISTQAGKSNWRMISFSLARQAEDILVIRHNDGTFEYKGGLGDLTIGDNVLVGRVTGNVLVRKGWQIGAGEFVYVRGGSVEGDGYDYSTSGYSVCLGGLVRLLEFASPEIAGTSWLAFIGDHIDLQYHSASYASPSSPWDGTTFKGLNFVFRGVPW